MLLHHLKFKRRKTVAEYAKIFDVSAKTIYRYIEELENHFLIDKDEYNRYFIHTEVNDDEISVSLTAEEMKLLHGLVIKTNNKLKDGLSQKLDLNLSLDLDHLEFHASKIDQLETAINNKKQVKLIGYNAAGTQTVKNRWVEPISITELKYLTAFDIEAKKTKIYMISRIQAVQVLEDMQSYEGQHKHLKPDVFGMFSGKVYYIQLKLGRLPFLLMREEFPRAIEFLRETDDRQYPYLFDSHVYGLEGIGRFALGLIDQIQIVKGEELKNYMKGKKNAVDKF